jgi:hypothetical protein
MLGCLVKNSAVFPWATSFMPLPKSGWFCSTGVVWAQAKALEVYRVAVKSGHFASAAGGEPGSGSPRSRLNLHALTAGVAMLSLFNWLDNIR